MSKSGFYASYAYHRLVYSSDCTHHMPLMCTNMWDLWGLLYQLYSGTEVAALSPRLDGFQTKCQPSYGGCCIQVFSHTQIYWNQLLTSVECRLGRSSKCKQVTTVTYRDGTNIVIITKIGKFMTYESSVLEMTNCVGVLDPMSMAHSQLHNWYHHPARTLVPRVPVAPCSHHTLAMRPWQVLGCLVYW